MRAKTTELRIRSAKDGDAMQVFCLARNNSAVLGTGKLGAMYHLWVIEDIIKEGISFTLRDRQVRGYMLISSERLWSNFGYYPPETAMESMLADYRVKPDGKSAFASQVCLDRKVREAHCYTGFHNLIIGKLRDLGFNSVYATIPESNTHSLDVHKHLGWEEIGSKVVWPQSVRGVVNYTDFAKLAGAPRPKLQFEKWKLIYRQP